MVVSSSCKFNSHQQHRVHLLKRPQFNVLSGLGLNGGDPRFVRATTYSSQAVFLGAVPSIHRSTGFDIGRYSNSLFHCGRVLCLHLLPGAIATIGFTVFVSSLWHAISVTLIVDQHLFPVHVHTFRHHEKLVPSVGVRMS